MTPMQMQRIFVLTFIIFVGLIATVHASGAEIQDFTGPVEQLFGALRSPTFVRIVGIGLLAMLMVGMRLGGINGGWVDTMGLVLVLGLWFGAESIADTIFATSGVLF